MVTRGFAQDFRLVLRTFRRKPAASALAILTLAVGVWATTTVFSVLNAIAFRDLPVKHPSDLAELSVTLGTSNTVGFSVPMVQALERSQQVFSSVVGFASELLNAEIGDDLTRVNVLPVTGNFFDELGIRPSAGRLIGPGDMNLANFSASRVAVLGYGFWQRAFGADPAAIGRTIRLDGKPYDIVGVAPRGFSGFNTFVEPDVSVPLAADAAENVFAPGLLWIHLVGRLKPGVTRERARGGLDPLWISIKREIVPAAYAPQRRANFLGLGMNVRSVQTGLEWNGRDRFTQPLWFALALAAIVLAVACLNVAGLMVARTAGQAHDFGIRVALGASMWSIRRQAIAEALVLATTGSALGLAMAQWTAPAVGRVMFEEWTGTIALQLAPDAHVVALVCAVVVSVCVLFGATPVWRVYHRDAASLLSGGVRVAARAGRLAPALVVAQVALALVASIDAGLLVRTLQHFADADPGFARANITAADLMPKPSMPYMPMANAETNAYHRRLIDAVRAATGVREVALAKAVPLIGMDGRRAMAAASSPSEQIGVAYDSVSPEFAGFLGLTFREGRDFTWSDDSTRPRVAIVSESLARRLAPGRSAVGEFINFGPTPPGQHIEIVGVIADIKLYEVKNGNPLTLLLPLLQDPETAEATVLMRGAVPIAPIKRAVADAGAEYVVRTRSLDEITRAATRQEQLAAIAGSIFGAIAVGLSALGLYGLLTYVVSRRRRELAIRAALGGRAWALVRLVVAQGAAIVAAGAALGGAAAIVNVRWMQSLLFGIRGSDALALATVPIVLAAASVAACALPAIRAARADPLILIKEE